MFNIKLGGTEGLWSTIFRLDPGTGFDMKDSETLIFLTSINGGDAVLECRSTSLKLCGRPDNA
jgi:hypothetical protein